MTAEEGEQPSADRLLLNPAIDLISEFHQSPSTGSDGELLMRLTHDVRNQLARSIFGSKPNSPAGSCRIVPCRRHLYSSVATDIGIDDSEIAVASRRTGGHWHSSGSFTRGRPAHRNDQRKASFIRVVCSHDPDGTLGSSFSIQIWRSSWQPRASREDDRG